MTTKKSKNIAAKKVWRIFRFKERYEMPEDMRKCLMSALEFTRDFVGDAGGDEAVGYQNQFKLLANGDGLEFGLYYGIYRQLVNMAAKRSRAYRGYLLDARNQPLNEGQIGKLLKIKTKEIKKILQKLASVDLLEKVDLPEFDLSKNKMPVRKSDDKNAKKPSKKTGGRKGAENSARKRMSLKNGKNVKKKHSKYLKGNDKFKKEINNDKRIRHNSNMLKGQAKDRTTTTPTTTPPFVPSESDAGGSVIPFHGPPGSANHNRSGTYYEPDAKEFAGIIYIALKLPWLPVSAKGKRDLGCFAKAWQKAQSSGISPQSLDSLWKRAIDVAHKIAKKRPKYPNPARVWRGLFNKLLASKCSKNQCKAM